MKKNLNSVCQICNSNLTEILDLKRQPPANSLHKNKKKQVQFPLVLAFCKSCSLVQLTKFPNKKVLFNKYFWVTETSSTAKKFSKVFYNKISKLIKNKSNILEIASNDGTFLVPFKRNGHNILGIDPAKNISKLANLRGIKTLPFFFDYKISKKIKNFFLPDFIFARNVIPHVSQLKSVINGIQYLSNDKTLIAIEFHYAGEILKDLQYDSIYHEHIYYFTIRSISKIFEKYNLYPFDFFLSPISAGAVVLFFSKEQKKMSYNLKKKIENENRTKINHLQTWKNFSKRVKLHAYNFKKKIHKIKNKEGKLFAYGASARSSTLLNFSNLNHKFIDFVIDQNKLKSNHYTPGTNIIIKQFKSVKKDINKYKNMILLAWNFEKEIKKILLKNKYKGKIILPLKKK
tara:strand:+ start:328 stop:1533 length:1206 start_codon:yes stop_codon:yes gene_type:complete